SVPSGRPDPVQCVRSDRRTVGPVLLGGRPVRVFRATTTPLRQTEQQKIISRHVRPMKGGVFPTCQRTGKVIYESHTKAVGCADELVAVGAEVQYAYPCKSCD